MESERCQYPFQKKALIFSGSNHLKNICKICSKTHQIKTSPEKNHKSKLYKMQNNKILSF